MGRVGTGGGLVSLLVLILVFGWGGFRVPCRDTA